MALAGKAVTDTADVAADAALAIGHCQVQPGSDEDKRARAVGAAHAPRGIGLHRLSPAEGSAAFLSSAALTNVEMTGAPEQFRPLDGSAGAGLRQERSKLRAYVGLTDPRGEVVDDVCLRTVLLQAQRDTSRATAASRLRSITDLHNGSSPLKRAQQHKARMLSCASRASSIWLTALPIHNALTLSNSAFCNAFQFRLGLSPRPMHAPRVRCGCGALVDPPPGSPEPDFFQHAQKCPHLAAAKSTRHNILCGTWCQVMQSAGVPTSLEPNCSRVAGSNPVTSAGDRADVLCVLQDRLLLSDVSVTHCCADTYVATAAATAGSETRAAKRLAKYALHEPGGYDFTPLVVESYGRQCSATHTLLNLLERLAADSGHVSKGRGSRVDCGD